MGREGWGREWWAVTEGRMLTIEKTKRQRQCYCHCHRPLLVCIACLPRRSLRHTPTRLLGRSWRWGCGCTWCCHLWVLVTLSLVGVGCSTAVLGVIRCCWAVDVVPWVLAVVCRLLSSLHAAFNWAVVICQVAGLFVVGVV